LEVIFSIAGAFVRKSPGNTRRAVVIGAVIGAVSMSIFVVLVILMILPVLLEQ
jgi:hypothetical protein